MIYIIPFIQYINFIKSIDLYILKIFPITMVINVFFILITILVKIIYMCSVRVCMFIFSCIYTHIGVSNWIIVYILYIHTNNITKRKSGKCKYINIKYNVRKKNVEYFNYNQVQTLHCLIFVLLNIIYHIVLFENKIYNIIYMCNFVDIHYFNKRIYYINKSSKFQIN